MNDEMIIKAANDCMAGDDTIYAIQCWTAYCGYARVIFLAKNDFFVYVKVFFMVRKTRILKVILKNSSFHELKR